MGFLDKVKEMASDGLEKGQDLAKGQQLKLELRKLEGQLEDAFTAFGKKAFEALEAGSLSADTVANEAQAIRDAQAALATKNAEIAALGAEAAAATTTE